MKFAIGATALVLFGGCTSLNVGDFGSGTGRTGTTGTTTGGSGGGSSAGAEQLCVDTINQYRATLGLAPYVRWTGAETCADGQSQSDSMTGQAHGAFGQCGEMAQNECPGWPPPADKMITGCLDAMWKEGPGDFNAGHGHYINMSSNRYTLVACGFYTTAKGEIWSVQDFN
jgi:Cysteine-rich secretory protein family